MRLSILDDLTFRGVLPVPVVCMCLFSHSGRGCPASIPTPGRICGSRLRSFERRGERREGREREVKGLVFIPPHACMTACSVCAASALWPCVQPALLDRLRALRADLCVTAAYGNMLPAAFLAVPPLGTLNIHPSLLPKYRGAAPVQRALQVVLVVWRSWQRRLAACCLEHPRCRI